MMIAMFTVVGRGNICNVACNLVQNGVT